VGVADRQKAVLLELRYPLAIVKLNRPERRNAMSDALLQELTAVLKTVEEDIQVRAVILTGEGHSFCAGADLKARGETAITTPLSRAQQGQRVYNRLMTVFRPSLFLLVNMKKPVIAAINGAAAGAGASLALACDFRVMANDAYLLQAFINVGLVPDYGGTYFLVRQIGYSKALELSAEGKKIDAATCLQLGLANKVVAPKDLLKTAEEWGLKLASAPTFALGLSKSAFRFAETHSLEHSFEYEARLQQYCGQSVDHQEGIDAFKQKRKPNFKGLPVGEMPPEVVARL
jgi:2-(1,2-epoxy-1,2-dihydrophenyl)acetyl-CoA isomerase